ncbi:MAG: SusC/RagA family TonB-linked outer membrane protein, partial [Bacteroidales bacterium]
MKKVLTKLKVLLLVSCGFLLSFNMFGQRTVTGTVTDAGTGEGLIGATVLVKGTTRGTVTDLQGNYSIEVSSSEDVLVFSYISYETIEEVVGDRTTINVTLKEAATELEDVVVIGYGTVKKSDLTGSVAVVTSEDLNRRPSPNFQQALQGKAPGVLVTSNSGLPGAGASIKIRGVGSINSDADPIYVIDGVITGSLGAINPADIESMQILKDASASAIYGADGANGVVIITTKRGESGKPRVSYTNYFSLTQVPKKLDLMNANQYANFYNTLNAEAGIYQHAYSDEFRQWYYGDGWEEGTDWQDEITQTGLAQNHSIRVSGGGENSNFSISGNYYNETGILINTAATRYNLRANSDFKIGEMLKIGETFNITRSISQNATNVFDDANIVSPLMKVYYEGNKEGYDGPQRPTGFQYIIPPEDETDTPDTINVSNTGGNDKTNPVAEAAIPDNKGYSNNFLGNIYLEFEPVDWLQYRVSGSFTGGTFRSKNWTPRYDLGVRENPQASLSENFSESYTLQLENQITFNQTFGDHSITATAVHQVRRNDGANISGTANGFPYENLNVFSQALEDGKILNGGYTTPFRMESYLARVIYDYRGKILFTGSIRRDGVSRFGPDNRWGNFPSASVAYKINEDFLQNVPQINMLKLRLGWGKTGNSNIGNFLYEDFLTPPNQFSPVFGDPNSMVTGTYIFYSFANPNIKWEASAMTNIGVDINALDNKIQATLEYYIKNTDNLLVEVPVSLIFGRANDGSNPFSNLGEIQNRGLESNITYKNYDGGFKYSVTLNLTTFKNTVKYLPVSEITSGNTRTIEGNTIGSLYGYVADGILQKDDFEQDENGNLLIDDDGEYLYKWAPPLNPPSPGDLKFKDLNNDGRVTDQDRAIIGKALPDMTASLNLECSYRNFDFSLFFNSMFRYQIYNRQKATLAGFVDQDINHNKLLDFAENYYTHENPSTEYIRADLGNRNQNDRISTWWIEDVSFVRVRDI